MKNMLTLMIITAFMLTFSIFGQGQENQKKTDKPKLEKGNPVVIMKTSMGTIKIELFQEKAPITVKNFLSYVDDKYFDKTVFHRIIKDFMIQGGGFTATDPLKQKATKPSIKNESDNGLGNERGTIAMARTPDPNSATSQFFINVIDNTFLNRSDRDAGYAVFGKVIEGMDVVDEIRNVPTGRGMAISLYQGKETPPQAMSDVPVNKVLIESIRRADAKK